MASTITSGTTPELSLQQLSDWLWGQESALGPVIAIGNNGHSTAATFRWSLTEPTVRADIGLAVDGQAVLPAEATKCCEGTVFIVNQLVDIVVYRV